MADARTQLLEGLKHSLGPIITQALDDENLLEVMVNPDGNIWVEKLGEEMKIAGTLNHYQARDVVILMASSLNFEAGVDKPVVQGELPLDGSRFHGVLPPNVSPQASFTLRKKASKVFPLEEYVEQGILPQFLYEKLKIAIADRKNIVVVGGTGSGKTTLLNALIRTMSQLTPDHRVLILEDTAELQCESDNKVFMRTSEALSMGGLVMTCLRYRPDRILVGEVRDGSALDLLKAWNTGHPGGFATLHANSAEEGLDRLEELTEEAGKGPKQKLIGRAVDLLLFIQKTPGGRKISEASLVHGYDPVTQTYKTEDIYHMRIDRQIFTCALAWSLALMGLCLLLPDLALASGGIDEFTGPVDKVMNTITGPVGKAVAIIGMALCGYYFITHKEDIAGGAKALLGVVFGICFIAFAMPIVNSVFSFSGAVI